MDTYTYPSSSPVSKVSFVKSDGGSVRAYLSASSASNTERLYEISCALAEAGFQCIPAFTNGESVLEVRAVGKEEKLLGLLEQKGAFDGQPMVHKGAEKPLGFIDSIKKRSLGASGMAYLVGDAAFSTYGYKGGSLLNTVGGVFYGAGTVSLLVGGRKDQSDLQIKDIAQKMQAYIKLNGSQIPDDCAVASITNDQNRTLVQKADELFRRYPSELMNMFFAVAGICIAGAAYKANIKTPLHAHEIEEVVARRFADVTKHLPNSQISTIDRAAFHNDIAAKMHVNHKREGWLDIGLGSMTALSGLFAMSVKEKKHDPDAPVKQGWEGVWEKIQEKPLAVAGVGYMISTLCHAVSTGIAWKYASNDRRKSVPFRAAFVGANILAELLLAISSKGHGDGVVSDKSVDDSIISLAADMILQQPAKLQPILTQQVANFLGQPNMLAMENQNVVATLTQRVEQMRDNPWAKAMALHHESNLKPEGKAVASNAGWQARAAQVAPASTTMAIH